ncbi:MAG: CcoQ/FixQ family Cbb3-type cytochrome c oxidase assembly chaperone [Desulfuromonadales bacterium]
MMDWGSITYLGVTLGLFIIFVLIVIRTYSKKRKDKGEIAKYRMLDDD